MSSTTSIRDHLATALHADRDHTRDGVDLGSEPICNCYTLADVAIAALGGVSVVRTRGNWKPGQVQERISFASYFRPEVSGSTGQESSTMPRGGDEL